MPHRFDIAQIAHARVGLIGDRRNHHIKRLLDGQNVADGNFFFAVRHPQDVGCVAGADFFNEAFNDRRGLRRIKQCIFQGRTAAVHSQDFQGFGDGGKVQVVRIFIFSVNVFQALFRVILLVAQKPLGHQPGELDQRSGISRKDSGYDFARNADDDRWLCGDDIQHRRLSGQQGHFPEDLIPFKGGYRFQASVVFRAQHFDFAFIDRPQETAEFAPFDDDAAGRKINRMSVFGDERDVFVRQIG